MKKLRALRACYVVQGQGCCRNEDCREEKITCSLLFDRQRGSIEIILSKRWEQTKLRDGQ